MATPVRTCIGCRRAVPVTELVRLALVDGRVQIEPRPRPGGRGAAIHAQAACVQGALRGGAWGRAFRTRLETMDTLEPDSLLPLLLAATIRKTP